MLGCAVAWGTLFNYIKSMAYIKKISHNLDKCVKSIIGDFHLDLKNYIQYTEL